MTRVHCNTARYEEPLQLPCFVSVRTQFSFLFLQISCLFSFRLSLILRPCVLVRTIFSVLPALPFTSFVLFYQAPLRNFVKYGFLTYLWVYLIVPEMLQSAPLSQPSASCIFSKIIIEFFFIYFILFFFSFFFLYFIVFYTLPCSIIPVLFLSYMYRSLIVLFCFVLYFV